MKKIIFDGAYGTNLMVYNKKIELLNITKPDVVENLQKKYILAGSDIITTNTFGISQYDKYQEIAENGVKVANKVTENTNVKVAFNVGPDFLHKDRNFYSSIKIIKDIDYIFIETMTNFEEIKKAVNVFKSWGKPMFLCVSPNIDLKLYDKIELSEICKFAEENNIQAIGVNCGFGIDHVFDCLVEISKHTSLPLIAKPNLGVEKGEQERLKDCGKLLQKFQKIIDLDVKYIGLCCGSTAEDIKVLSSNINLN